jgi:hypothetical protein
VIAITCRSGGTSGDGECRQTRFRRRQMRANF